MDKGRRNYEAGAERERGKGIRRNYEGGVEIEGAKEEGIMKEERLGKGKKKEGIMKEER